MSPAYRRLQITGLLYALTFLIAVQVFLFLPEPLIAAFNWLSPQLFPALPLAPDQGKFWLSLAGAMMYTITVLCWFLWRDPQRYAEMALAVVVSKLASSGAGLSFFLIGVARPETGWATLPNLVIACTDLPLGLWLLWCYRAARQESPAANAALACA